MPFGTIISVEVVRDSTGAPQVRCRGWLCGHPACSTVCPGSWLVQPLLGAQADGRQACTLLWPAGVI